MFTYVFNIFIYGIIFDRHSAHKSLIDMPRPSGSRWGGTWSIDCTYSMSNQLRSISVAHAHVSCGYCDRHCLIAVCNYCSPPSSHYPGSLYVPRLKVTDSRRLTKWQSASAASQSPAQAAGHSSLLHWNRRRHHRCCLARCHLPAWLQPATRSSSQAATRRNQFIWKCIINHTKRLKEKSDNECSASTCGRQQR